MMSITQRTPVVVQSSKTLLNCIEKTALRPGPSQEALLRGAGEKVQVAFESTVESLSEVGGAVKETLMTGISKVTEVGSTTGQVFRETAELNCNEVKQIGRNVADGFKGSFPTNLGQTEEKALGTAEQNLGEVSGVAANQIGEAEGLLAEQLKAAESVL